MEFDIDAWMNQLKEKLLGEFGERLALLGLQGSRARGEARANSDIDIVAVIDELDFSTLQIYKSVISRMPHADLACGFVSSPKILAAWPRYDSFNLVMDTNIYYGSFDFMNTNYSADDAIDAAKMGASMVYHSVCHGMLFEKNGLSDIIAGCIKSTFFIMRVLTYARTGEYPKSRSRMRELASDDEKAFLDAYDRPDSIDAEAMAQRLLMWSSGVLADSCD